MITKRPKQIESVGLKELRANMETYIKKVKDGQSLVVLRRSEPLFKITPVEIEGESWETVVDFVAETGRGVSLDEVLKVAKSING